MKKSLRCFLVSFSFLLPSLASANTIQILSVDNVSDLPIKVISNDYEKLVPSSYHLEEQDKLEVSSTDSGAIEITHSDDSERVYATFYDIGVSSYSENYFLASNIKYGSDKCYAVSSKTETTDFEFNLSFSKERGLELKDCYKTKHKCMRVAFEKCSNLSLYKEKIKEMCKERLSDD